MSFNSNWNSDEFVSPSYNNYGIDNVFSTEKSIQKQIEYPTIPYLKNEIIQQPTDKIEGMFCSILSDNNITEPTLIIILLVILIILGYINYTSLKQTQETMKILADVMSTLQRKL
jgi:hypothetical protein